MDILLIFISAFGLSFFIAYLYTARQLKITTKHLAETMLLYFAATEQKDYEKEIVLDDDKIHKENFIKFLSDSREWAFDYIEKVQAGLKDFIEIADKEFSYFEEYGILAQEYPHYKTMEKISKEYKKLKELLPEDMDDRR